MIVFVFHSDIVGQSKMHKEKFCIMLQNQVALQKISYTSENDKYLIFLIKKKFKDRPSNRTLVTFSTGVPYLGQCRTEMSRQKLCMKR